ncbi:hypothetical protein PROPHIGD54-2_156 [Mycobacterium phage prophiGD54-2]|uniref:hypothetical protein n=1 Tax=Mycobacteroides abscessus TaxID=36809 RepID=UPI0019D0678D|nr:hypothetical protein [Mycobacteroides abscessus]QSM04734.1 hypothetical protein PROPHIGD54-2_156 [Mycobacterium phage prophiGD54-2]QSN19586.1 hypothetical protein I3U41_16795 [Mycobacteroides abscessus subsp. abscessus]
MAKYKGRHRYTKASDRSQTVRFIGVTGGLYRGGEYTPQKAQIAAPVRGDLFIIAGDEWR